MYDHDTALIQMVCLAHSTGVLGAAGRPKYPLKRRNVYSLVFDSGIIDNSASCNLVLANYVAVVLCSGACKSALMV